MKGEWVEDEEECGGGMCEEGGIVCVCVCVYERTECTRGGRERCGVKRRINH